MLTEPLIDIGDRTLWENWESLFSLHLHLVCVPVNVSRKVDTEYIAPTLHFQHTMATYILWFLEQHAIFRKLHFDEPFQQLFSATSTLHIHRQQVGPGRISHPEKVALLNLGIQYRHHTTRIRKCMRGRRVLRISRRKCFPKITE